MRGRVVPLAELADGVFSEEMLGKGCGLWPSDETVVAPFDGQVTAIAKTGHAIGVTSRNGIEVLIHIGLDTVEMAGAGFRVKVRVGDQVTLGQTLMTFSRSKIEDAGYQLASAVVVTNSDEYETVDVLVNGQTARGQAIIGVAPPPAPQQSHA